MTDDEIIEAFSELIKPMWQFWNTRKQMPFIPDSEIHYQVPAQYLRGFHKLYEEIILRNGTQVVVDMIDSAS